MTEIQEGQVWQDKSGDVVCLQRRNTDDKWFASTLDAFGWVNDNRIVYSHELVERQKDLE